MSNEQLLTERELQARMEAAGLDDEQLVRLTDFYNYGPLRPEHIEEAKDGGWLRRVLNFGFLVELRIKGDKGGGKALVLGHAGRSYVCRLLGLRGVSDQVEQYTKPFSWLHHDIRVADFMVPFMREGERLGAEEVEWLTPQNNPDPEGFKIVRWDAAGYVALFDNGFGFVLESDCNTEENPKFAEKVTRYQTYLDNHNWREALTGDDEDNLTILAVTTGSDGRMQRMRQEVIKVLAKTTNSNLQRWMFTTYDRLAKDTIRNPLYAPVWYGCGLSEVGVPVLDVADDLTEAQDMADQLLAVYDRQIGDERASTHRELLRLHEAVAILSELAAQQ